MSPDGIKRAYSRFGVEAVIQAVINGKILDALRLLVLGVHIYVFMTGMPVMPVLYFKEFSRRATKNAKYLAPGNSF